MLTWLAGVFVGKKTYAALGVLLLKWLAQSQGVEVAEGELSTAVDVALVLAAALGRKVAQVAADSKIVTPPLRMPWQE
jgi:hypothetical protein